MDNNQTNDLPTNLKLLLIDRFSSPLIFSFVISWVLINYRFFIIIFYTSKIEYKMKLLNWYFFSPDYYFVLPCIVYPALSAIAYVFCYPYVNRVVMRFVIERKIQEMKDKSDLEKSAVFTYEEVRKHIERHDNEVSELKNQLAAIERSEAYHKQHAQLLLEQINSNALAQGANPKVLSTPSDYNISPDEYLFMTEIVGLENQGESSVDWDYLMGFSVGAKVSQLDLKLAIGNLQEKGYLSMTHDIGGKPIYSLTHKGRAFYRQMRDGITTPRAAD